MSRPEAQTGRGRESPRGFTLIEVLISIGLLAAITALMWVTIDNMFRTRDFVTEQYERYQIMRVAMDRMNTEVASAYVASPAHGAERKFQKRSQGSSKSKNAKAKAIANREPVEFGMRGREDELHFTSFAHVRTTEGERASHHAEIGYYIKQTRQDGELVESLVRREDTTLDDDITEGGKVYTLVPEVRDVEFEYWDPGEVKLGTQKEMGQGQWVREWDTGDEEYHDRLPFRVKITVTLPPLGPRGKERTFTTQTEIQTHQELDL